jgi:hypothetical protein
VVVFLSRWFPEDTFYKTRMADFVKDWTQGGAWVKFTPKGLAFSGEWGSLRHVGNALFLMEAYANGAADAALTRKVDCFAHGQVRPGGCAGRGRGCRGQRAAALGATASTCTGGRWAAWDGPATGSFPPKPCQISPRALHP